MSESGTASASVPPTRASSAPSRASSRYGRPGQAAVRQHAAPVRLGAVVQRVPVPVLDHPGAARDERPRGLPPLARRRPGCWCSGRRWTARWSRSPGTARRGWRTSRRPTWNSAHVPWAVQNCGVTVVLGCSERRPACRSRRCPLVTSRTDGQVGVLQGGPLVRDARGDELVLARQGADRPGLPVDHLGGQRRLEPAPGQVVLRLHVAVRGPQVRPRRQPVRPVHQAPLPVEGLDVAVRVLAGGRRTAGTPPGCAAGAGPARCPPGTRRPPGGPGSARRSWSGRARRRTGRPGA